VEVPRDWEALVRRPLDDRAAEALLTSLRRGRPYGDERWAASTAAALGLSHTLNPRGRPRNPKPQTPGPRKR
jgi:hypothetical protein